MPKSVWSDAMQANPSLEPSGARKAERATTAGALATDKEWYFRVAGESPAAQRIVSSSGTRR